MTGYLKRQPFLAVLIFLQTAVLLPFCFLDGFGERDSYRMFLGLIDTVKSGEFFNSSLLYNREASFGYFGLLYTLTSVVGHNATKLILLMNGIGLVSVILFTIPSYIVAERLLGKRVAMISGLTLIATPVWWHCGLYAHPISTALLFFFTGLAILSRYSRIPPPAVRAVVLVLLTLALTIRFDVVLLFIALVALLFQVRQASWRSVVREAAWYVIGPLAFFCAVQNVLPPISHGSAPPSIVGLLARFEQTADILGSTRQSIISLTEGFTPILLIGIPLSAWILIRKKDYVILIFVVGEVLANLIFWFPNTQPPRHYLLMALAVSLSAAIVVVEVVSRWFEKPTPAQDVSAGAAVAITVVAISLAFNYGKSYLSYFPSQLSDRLAMKAKITQANAIAESLVSLPALQTPFVVFCDSNLVLAKMEQLAGDTSAIYRVVMVRGLPVGLHEVHQGNNQFVMVEQSWEASQIKGFDESGEYARWPVLSGPYLPIEYRGPRDLLRDLGDREHYALEKVQRYAAVPRSTTKKNAAAQKPAG